MTRHEDESTSQHPLIRNDHSNTSALTILDEFQLPSIEDIPHICLILEIARYMPDKECSRVFQEIIPELECVNNLMKAERESRKVRSHMQLLWSRFIYVKNSRDVAILFPGGVRTYLESTIPYPDNFFWHKALDHLQKAWIGKESLYSIPSKVTDHDLLDVSTDEAELWTNWSFYGECNHDNYDSLCQSFCEVDSFDEIPGSIIDNKFHSTHYKEDKYDIWISHDRKIMLKIIFTHRGFPWYDDYFRIAYTGLRSRSQSLLNWVNEQGPKR